MCRVTVLKFGGSVLRDEHTMADAAREILRCRERGHGIVAVVSALHGVTDALLQRTHVVQHRISDASGPDQPRSDAALAAIAALGEHESAGWLALQLSLLGQPAAVLTPAALLLRAVGPALDADPVSVATEPLVRTLLQGQVAIVPGFAALDAESRPVVLGRGGSDLTALYLTAELQRVQAVTRASCRLIKDVDGLYDRDPNAPGARRFMQATYADCLQTDGSIIQFKAIRFAQAHGLPFALGGIGRDDPTQVGHAKTRWADSKPSPVVQAQPA